MMKCRSLTAALFIGLCFCSFSPGPVSANVGGYTVEPVTVGMDVGVPLETTQDTIWDLTPRDIATILALSLSPTLLFPVELFFLLKMFAYLGYRKIATRNALENDVRGSIYTCIRTNPGIHFNALSRETEIKPGTMKYHLSILKITNKIVFFETAGHTRYFENSGKYSPTEQKVLRFLRSKRECVILELLLMDPDMTRRDLEQRLNISGAAVSWHMSRLSDEGILVVRKIGRDARYEINPETRPYIEKYLSPVQEKPS
jgi:predicted transcriptional regulator